MSAERRSLAAVLLASLLLLGAGAAGAAEVIIVNNDPPGQGLNDPTAAAPIAGNPGVTLGEQRLNVLQRAAEIWADNLISDVPIRINAQTASQFCDATSAVLASAGANVIFQNFANAPFANTWYHGALANALAGTDLDPAENDINTQFNINLDEDPNCLGGSGWYYGYDHNEGPQTDLLAVMLHEYGHGLGFANFANESAGTLFQDTPDVFTTFTRDLETGEDWNDMTNAERQASAINDPNVVWTGSRVTEAVPFFLQGASIVTVNSPPSIAGQYAAQSAAFGPPVPDEGLTGDVVLADDSTGPDVNDGCEALTNGAAINGNIAQINRGSCNFSVKVANAQAVGAIGVIIANNQPTGLPPMGGDDPTITIPSVGVSFDTGAAIAGELPGVEVTLGYDFTQLAGTAAGFLRLHAPDPVQSGSSISHWTIDANPSLLMEPSITPDLTDDVDLTLEHFQDIGWTLIEVFADGFETGNCDRWSSAAGDTC